jgi:hypothetical protein
VRNSLAVLVSDDPDTPHIGAPASPGVRFICPDQGQSSRLSAINSASPDVRFIGPGPGQSSRLSAINLAASPNVQFISPGHGQSTGSPAPSTTQRSMMSQLDASAQHGGRPAGLPSSVRLAPTRTHPNQSICTDPGELLALYRNWRQHRLCDPSLFEVRAVPALCKVNEPTQLGVFYIGQDPLPVKQRLMFYSAHCTHRSYYDDKPRSTSAYVRRMWGTDMCLDGMPKAFQYKRYIASTPAGLDWVNNLPASAFEPSQHAWSDEQRKRFNEEPIGCIINSPVGGEVYNVRMDGVNVAGMGVPVHIAAKEIKRGDQLLVRYCDPQEKRGFVSESDEDMNDDPTDSDEDDSSFDSEGDKGPKPAATVRVCAQQATSSLVQKQQQGKMDKRNRGRAIATPATRNRLIAMCTSTKSFRLEHVEDYVCAFMVDHHLILECCLSQDRLLDNAMYPLTDAARMKARFNSTWRSLEGMFAWRLQYCTGARKAAFFKGLFNRFNHQNTDDLRWSAPSDCAVVKRPILHEGYYLCIACYCRSIGMAKRTYTRRYDQLLTVERVAAPLQATPTPPEVTRSYGSGVAPKGDWARTAIAAIHELRGSEMPHTDAVQIDGISSRVDYYTLVREIAKERGCEPDAVPSNTTIERAIKDHYGNSTLITSNRTELGKCEKCTSYMNARLSKDLPVSMRQKLDLEKRAHLTEQAIQRFVFYANNAKADIPAYSLLSLVMDGMDQSKTSLPHVQRAMKNDNLAQQKVHITGVQVHGGPIHAFAFVNYSDVHNDSNLSVEVLQRTLAHTFHRIDEDNAKLPAGAVPKQRPRCLAISLDNAANSNKNFTLFAYLSSLVATDVFESVEVNFFLVGHGHNQIDQMFSRFSVALRQTDCFTPAGLFVLLRNAYSREPDTAEQASIKLAQITQRRHLVDKTYAAEAPIQHS